MDIEARIKEWAQAFPAAEVEARVAELETVADRQREALAETEREIERLRQLGQLGTRLFVPATPTAPDSLALAFGSDDRPPRPKRRRDQVLYVFGGDRERVMHLDQIARVLFKLGWLRLDQKDRHALQMTLSNMVTKSHDLVRPQMGHYQLAGKSDGGP